MEVEDLQKEIKRLNRQVQILANVRAQDVAAIVKGFVAKYGDEALQIAADAHTNMVGDDAAKMAKNFEPNAKGIAELLSVMHTNVGITGEVIEATPKRSVRRETKCPFAGVWPAEYCEIIHGPSLEKTAKMVNPKIKVIRTKHLGNGDEYCEYAFELED
ncbi:MAG: L-2-amino-thiazoline-4-carboxylic acid hydrolase [Chloroflexota bacterium]|nr:L-2-amino-thiazoline-4-carboxylic acid hydrolase [Chloroflexota bacterium]